MEGPDEDIIGMESRTTPIQEGEDDEDIVMLDTHVSWSSPSCNSSPTRLPRPARFQQTPRHSFGNISLIRHRNGAFLEVLERGQRRVVLVLVLAPEHRGSCCVTTKRCCITYFGPTLALYRVGP